MNVVHNPSVDFDPLSLLYSPCSRQESIEHTIRVKIEEVSNIIFPQDQINSPTDKEKLQLEEILPMEKSFSPQLNPSYLIACIPMTIWKL